MRNNGKYFFIPDCLLKENSQTIHAYIYILNEINNNGGELIITKNELAKTLNASEKQIRTIFSKMAEVGQIKGRSRAGIGTVLSIDFIGVVEDFKNDKGRSRSEVGQNTVRETTKKIQPKQPIEERRVSFIENLKEFTELYDKDLLNDFYRYWSEPTTKGDKMRYELQKTWSLNLRLITWSKNNQKHFSKSEKPIVETIGRTSIETIKKNNEYHGRY
jgi:DNA-binding IscR family transcriptional regulator